MYAKCDALDGAKDNIVSNVKACNAAFDVKTLRCANGTDSGDSCLSDAQLGAVAKIASDYKPGFAVAGMDTFPRWAFLEGALFRERSNWGSVPQPSNPLSGKEPLLYTAGDQTAKFIITRDPALDTMTFDPKQSERIKVVASIMDVSDEPESSGEGRQDHHDPRHGRLHHAAQQRALLPAASEAVRQVGGQLRRFCDSGFGHGFGLLFADRQPAALREWWRRKAPAGLIATDGNPVRTRGRSANGHSSPARRAPSKRSQLYCAE